MIQVLEELIVVLMVDMSLVLLLSRELQEEDYVCHYPLCVRRTLQTTLSCVPFYGHGDDHDDVSFAVDLAGDQNQTQKMSAADDVDDVVMLDILRSSFVELTDVWLER